MSVKNIGSVDPRTLIGKGTIGLLNATGTYDITRYPWAYDCWKRQQQTHWMGEEVPLGADIRDWQSGHLNEADSVGHDLGPCHLARSPATPRPTGWLARWSKLCGTTGREAS